MISQTQTYLTGFDLELGATGSFNSGIIYFENGRIIGNLTNTEYGIIRGPGDFKGNLGNIGRIELAGNNIGLMIIEGNLIQYTGGIINFSIGGNEVWQYSQLIVLGNAVFAGNIEVTLLNGFTPNPENPDIFHVISFTSYEGNFENLYIDLGNNICLEINYEENGVFLITL